MFGKNPIVFTFTYTNIGRFCIQQFYLGNFFLRLYPNEKKLMKADSFPMLHFGCTFKCRKRRKPLLELNFLDSIFIIQRYDPEKPKRLNPTHTISESWLYNRKIKFSESESEKEQSKLIPVELVIFFGDDVYWHIVGVICSSI